MSKRLGSVGFTRPTWWFIAYGGLASTSSDAWGYSGLFSVHGGRGVKLLPEKHKLLILKTTTTTTLYFSKEYIRCDPGLRAKPGRSTGN